MDFEKDYYAVLGIEPTAHRAEIRSAYEEAAHKYDPSLFPPEKREEALKTFTEKAEAYFVLGDKQRRILYDAQRNAPIASTPLKFSYHDQPVPSSRRTFDELSFKIFLEKQLARPGFKYPDFQELLGGIPARIVAAVLLIILCFFFRRDFASRVVSLTGLSMVPLSFAFLYILGGESMKGHVNATDANSDIAFLILSWILIVVFFLIVIGNSLGWG